MNEASIIDAIRATFAGLVAPGAWDFVDDAAALPPVAEGHVRVVTTDVSVEGVDFDLALYPPMYVGTRALAQNVSDLSAMGAVPKGFVWSLCLPPSWVDAELSRVRELARGAAVIAKLRNMPLLGGDLSRTTGPLVVSVTAFGDVRGLPVRRSGARPGDVLWVSARLGASAAGLRALRERRDPAAPFDIWRRGLSRELATCVRAHLMPLPAEPTILIGASAAIDVSDGLALDAHRLAEASGVRLELDALDGVTAPGATRDDALRGGEDYALLFAAPDSTRTDAIRVGRVVEGAGVWEGGMPLAAQGWDHFAASAGES